MTLRGSWREFVLILLEVVIGLLIIFIYPNRLAELLLLAGILIVALYSHHLWRWSSHRHVLIVGRLLLVLVVFVLVALGTIAIIVVTASPVIDRVEPSQIFVGEQISIFGRRFPADAGGAITINGVPATIEAPTQGQPLKIIAAVPEGVKSGSASVRVHNGWFLWRDTTIEVIGAPAISAVTPSMGFAQGPDSAGTTVEITGKNFGRQSGGGSQAHVSLGIPAPASESGTSRLVVQVPANAPRGTELELSVQTPAGTARQKFYVYGQPRIERVTPNRGFAQTDEFAGTRVTILGSDFDDLHRDNAVLFGGVSAGVTEVTRNKVVAHVPREAKTGKVVVRTRAGSGTSLPDFATIGRPRIADFQPQTQAPDEVVKIAGENFGDNAEDNRVLIGEVEAPVIGTDPDGRTLTIRVPRNGTDGLISLTTPAGIATGPERFQILPKITRFLPRGGPPGEAVTVYGYGFLRNATVRLGQWVPSQASQVRTAETGEQAITFTVPSGATEGNITVSNDARRKGTSTERFFVHRELREIQFHQFPPRTVEYRYGKKRKTYQTECDRNLVHVTDIESSGKSTIGVEQCPTDIVLDPNFAAARAYVTNFGANTINVIDLNIDQVVGTIESGGNPVRIVILHGWLHVLNAGAPQKGAPGSVRSISLRDSTRVVENSVGLGPFELLLDESKSSLYVLNSAGEITGILAEAPSQIRVIRTGAPARAFRLRRDKAYVANFGNDSVAVVDLQNGRVVKVIPLGAGAAPFGIAVHPKRPEVFVTKSGRDAVTIIDAERDEIARPDIKVGKRPLGIGLSPSGCIGLVVNSVEGTVSILDPDVYKVRGQPIRLTSRELADVEIVSDRLGRVIGRASQHEIAISC